MYISSATALDMLSAHAPRPWCKRVLAYMALNHEITMYFLSGKVTDKDSIFLIPTKPTRIIKP
jgi:hypothetical protein